MLNFHFTRKPISRFISLIMTLFVSYLINCRWWLGWKVCVGAVRWWRVWNNIHRSSFHWNDCKFMQSSLGFRKFKLQFPTAWELLIVVRPSRISRNLFILRQKFLLRCRACSSSPLDQRKYSTKGCYTCRQQIWPSEKSLYINRRFVYSQHKTVFMRGLLNLAQIMSRQQIEQTILISKRFMASKR